MNLVVWLSELKLIGRVCVLLAQESQGRCWRVWPTATTAPTTAWTTIVYAGACQWWPWVGNYCCFGIWIKKWVVYQLHACSSLHIKSVCFLMGCFVSLLVSGIQISTWNINGRVKKGNPFVVLDFLFCLISLLIRSFDCICNSKACTY